MILLITFLISSIFIICIFLLSIAWKRLKFFFHDDSYPYFGICFISLYFIEQVIFIVISYFYKEYNILLTGLFALIVVSTVSFQKVMYESRNKKIFEMSSKSIEKMKLMKQRYEPELDKISEDF